MNRAVFIMGGNGAGKTTLRMALVKGVPKEEKVGKSKITIYDNYVLLGNHSSGTDSLNNRDSFRTCFKEALKHNRPVLIDGVLASPLWVQAVLESLPIEVFVFAFKLDLMEHLRRLERRTGAITEKKIGSLRSNIGRVHLFIERITNARKTIEFGLTVTELDNRITVANKEVVENVLQ